MRTLLAASHVIGHDGRGHVIWRDGEVVFDDDRIVFVGCGFDGHVDRREDFGEAVIGPGFVDLDALGDLDSTVLTFDNGDDASTGRIWSEDYFRAGPTDAYTPAEETFKYSYAFAQLLLNGITTAMPITSMYYRAWAETYAEFETVARVAAEIGLRTYLGPCYMSGMTVVGRDGQLTQLWDEARGLDGLAAAERFIRDFDGRAGGLIRAMLAPDRIETCTPELLRRSARLRSESGVPIRLHCCQSSYEVNLVERLRGCSPYAWLQQLGLLTRGAILPHGIHLRDGDLARLASSGAAIVHCPVVFARDGEVLRSFARYRERGVPIAMGTDTFPPDMIDNLRQGLNLCRVADGANTASAADFYCAATLGGAEALGRSDIGRLAPGTQADITVFDLSGLHLGPFIDPIKTMVLAGSGRDVTDVWIAGRQVVAGRRIAGADPAALRHAAQRQFEKLKSHQRSRAPGDPAMDAVFRPSFPRAN